MAQSNKNNNSSNRSRKKVHEKPNNFRKSISRMFNKLGNKKIILIIALIFAILSSVITIYSPNKLSELTDVISESIKIDERKIEDLGKTISKNVQENPNSPLEYDDKNISFEDQIIFLETMKNLGENIKKDNDVEFSEEKQEETLNLYNNIPKDIKDIIEPKTDLNRIWSIAQLLIILYIISALFNYIEAFIIADLTNDYARDLRSDVSNKINRLPLNYFDTHKIGDIISRITNDVDTISMSLNQSLGSLATSISLLIGSVIMMFITNWIMALVAIISSLLGFILVSLTIKKSQKYFKTRQQSIGQLNGHIEESFSGLNIIKAYNAEKETKIKFDEYNKKLFEANTKSKFISSLMLPIMMFVGNLGYVSVSIVGAVLARNEVITFGVIVAFMTYVRLFTNPLSRIAQSLSSLQSSVAASERVFEFLDEKELEDESNIKNYINPEKVKGKIEFKNIIFQYPSNDKPTIKGFSAIAKPGQKVAIVGPTGAGKSTMVNLLMKFYNIKEGDILIDGNSIHDIKRENVHELFTMILQDTWLFNGTIRENIKYNMEDVTEEELNTLIKFIGLDHFIKTLPHNLDTVIKDNESVSAGQRQLLTIARGMLKDAPFLILDEATSNVDTRTEETIQEAMDKLMEGKTSFIIAHRLSTIVNADLILVMNEGNIIEQGTHEELLELNGFYSDLYNSQFSL